MKTSFLRTVIVATVVCVLSAAAGHTAPPKEYGAPRGLVVPDMDKDPGFWFMLADQSEAMGDNEAVLAFMKKAIELDPTSAYLNTRISSILARNRKIAEAMLIARCATLLDPKSDDAYTLLGKIYTVTGDRQRAVDAYARALDLKPDERDLYVFLGSLQASQRLYEDAERTFVRMMKQFPEEKEGYFYLGKVFIEDKQYDKAIEIFQSLLDKGGDIASQAYVELGAVYLVQKKYPEAEEHFRNAVKLDPYNINARLNLGQSLAGRKNFDEAYKVFEDLGKIAPSNQNIQIRMAMILAEQKEFDKAAEILSRILQTKPAWDQVRFQLGRIRKEQGKLDEAEKEFVQIRKGPAFLHSRIMLSLMFIKVKDLGKAMRYVDEAMDGESRDPDLFHIKGSILEELNRFTEAIEVYQRALEVEPKNNRVRYSMGNVLEKSGRRSQAIIEMEKILQDKPDDAGALNFVGYTLTVAGRDREKAEGMIRKAHELKPDDGYILDSFAWMLVQRGELDEGLEKLKLAAEKVKSDPVVCEHLGDAYLAKGDKQSAVEAFKKSLQINPENVVVKKKLEGLEKELGARTTQ